MFVWHVIARFEPEKGLKDEARFIVRADTAASAVNRVLDTLDDIGTRRLRETPKAHALAFNADGVWPILVA